MSSCSMPACAIAPGSPAEVRHNPQRAQGLSRRRRHARAPAQRRRCERLARRGPDRGQAHRRLWRRAGAASDVSFDVRPGEMVAMLGANGAGKSTIMRAISRTAAPGRAATSCSTTSRSTRSKPTASRARGLALVPEGRQVFPELSVLDNLVLGAHTPQGRRSRRARSRRCSNAFRACASGSTSRAGLLSGGEQQMLAIARGLMAKPRILLLDEPSLGLAPAMINELFDILAELRDEGVTILLVDQMAALALTVADRGYVLESGRIVRVGQRDGDWPTIRRSRRPISAAPKPRNSGHTPCRSISILRQGRLTGSDRAAGRHRHRATAASPTSPPSHRCRRAGEAARRPAGGARLRRDPHPSRQVLHPRPLQLRARARSRKRSPTVAAAKRAFTEDDVYARAQRTLEKAIMQGTTRMRTHVEVDPRIGLSGFHALRDAEARLRLGASTCRSACSRRKA